MEPTPFPTACRSAAESRKVVASTRTATSAETTLIRAPATAGEAIRARLTSVACVATALVNSSPSTTSAIIRRDDGRVREDNASPRNNRPPITTMLDLACSRPTQSRTCTTPARHRNTWVVRIGLRPRSARTPPARVITTGASAPTARTAENFATPSRSPSSAKATAMGAMPLPNALSACATETTNTCLDRE